MKKLFWTGFVFLLFWEIFSLLPTRHSQLTATRHAQHYIRGIIHAHSVYSDGGGTVPEIAEAASQAGIDFLILTDHNSSGARKDGFERRYDNVDLFVEMEASTPAGHLLTFFSHTPARSLPDAEVAELAYKHFLGTATERDLFVVTAHPSNIKNPWNRFDRYSEGIEVVNFDSSWQRQLSDSVISFFGTLTVSPFNPFLSALRFFQIYPKDLSSWDAMNAVTPGHFAILAHDTHSKLKINHAWSLPWPSYEQTFKLASNVVFLKDAPETDFEKRKRQIYESIRDGRIALHFHSLFPFDGNSWSLNCGGTSYFPGDTNSTSNEACKFEVSTPLNFPYKIGLRLWKNGDLTYETMTHNATSEIPFDGPGSYRLEVWAHPHTFFRLLLNSPVPYVLYNPIYAK